MERDAAVSGLFYPGDPSALKKVLTDYLEQRDLPPIQHPRAIISPHAGYIYSGAIAGLAFASLRAAHFTTVLVLGPAHHVPLTGVALSSASSFLTPFGKVEVAKGIKTLLAAYSFVQVSDLAHQEEHSIEVQLPFIQYCFPNAKIIPILVGSIRPEQLADLINVIASKEHTGIVVSSDLSHYLPYEEAKRQDAATSKSIEKLAHEEIRNIDACGASAIRGLLAFAKEHNLSGKTVKTCNSGDTAGTKDRVVGYGAYLFS